MMAFCLRIEHMSLENTRRKSKPYLQYFIFPDIDTAGFLLTTKFDLKCVVSTN
jgi:hypothetical protein